LQLAAVRVIARLPDRLKTALSGEPAIVIDGQQLDPQAQFLRSVRRRRVKRTWFRARRWDLSCRLSRRRRDRTGMACDHRDRASLAARRD
jgi:hypothetical protein